MTKKFAELWTDEDIEEIVNQIYKNCDKHIGGCENCPYKNDVAIDTCKCDIIMELWRKWRNLKDEQE